MKTIATMLVILAVCLAAPAFAQTSCVQLGAWTSCSGPSGQSFHQFQAYPNHGVTLDSRGYVEPYTITVLPNRLQPEGSLRDVLPPSHGFDSPRSAVPPLLGLPDTDSASVHGLDAGGRTPSWP